VGEKLTWDEIKKRFPDEWVVLVDYDWPDDADVQAGVVWAHGRDHDEVCDRSRAVPSPFAIRYTGQVRGGLIGFYAEDLDPAA